MENTASTPLDVPRLELSAAIGYNGKVSEGFKVHPKRQHILYPLGCTVVIQDINCAQNQEFLSGHTNDVTAVAVSSTGRFVASGQVTYMGFKADIIVWDFETRSIYAKFTLHKVKVQSLAFSPSEKYLISLGGQDDGNVVVWDLEKREPICGSPAQVESAGTTLCLAVFNNTDERFITAGEYTMRIWCLDRPNRKILPTAIDVGKLKRIVKCLSVCDDDSYFYAGTTSGDVMAINTATHLFQQIGPEKNKFSMGVTALVALKSGDILVGTGNGEVQLTKGMAQKFKRIKDKCVRVDGAVSAIALRGQGHQFFVGDSKSHMYRFNFAEFTHELVNTCHYSSVNDIVFPCGTSELFATCSYQDIRIWHLQTNKELLRVSIPNMTCNAIRFMRDGKTIVSAWDDGKIRAFFPESGRLMYTINDAHQNGVTAIATTSDCTRIISGGGEGQVRVWAISACRGQKGPVYTHRLVEAMKEHKGAVSCIRVKANDQECVSSSTDGTCIIWDLRRFTRNQILFANTLFKCVQYRPDECQVVTSGTDRKIGYWEILDGQLIRELEGSKSGSINGLDIDPLGQYIVTGGDDCLVKVWKYQEGEVTHVGLGHSAAINRICICPNSKHIISVSSDGAVFRWKFPEQCLVDETGDASL